jgi:very-short-patch-repair endonuclease
MRLRVDTWRRVPRFVRDVLPTRRLFWGERRFCRLWYAFLPGRRREVGEDDTTMAISRSKAEKALLRMIREAGLPMPETNVKFGRFEADFVWHEQKLIVELDSATYHSGPGVFQRDREKSLFFRCEGFDVLRPNRAHVVHQGARVLVLLAQALAA